MNEAKNSIAEKSSDDKEKERKLEAARIRNARYRAAHPERVKAKRERDSERNKEYQKKWYLKNQERLKAKKRAYYAEHREEIISKQSEYAAKNRVAENDRHASWVRSQKLADPEAYRKKRAKICVDYINRRKKNDPAFLILTNFRCRIKDLMRRKGFSKHSTTMELVGCSFEQLRVHIESQFEPWMTWSNYGFGEGKWVVDHIVPLARFDHADPEQAKAAWHHTNLRPLCWRRNMEKSDS